MIPRLFVRDCHDFWLITLAACGIHNSELQNVDAVQDLAQFLVSGKENDGEALEPRFLAENDDDRYVIAALLMGMENELESQDKTRNAAVEFIDWWTANGFKTHTCREAIVHDA